MSHNLRQIIILSVSVLLFATLFSCVMTQVRSTRAEKEPMPFRSAVQLLANELMTQVRKDRGILMFAGTSVIIDPFVDADTKESPRISRSIEKIIAEEAARNFRNFKVARVTSKNLQKADYLMNGTIRIDWHTPETSVSRKYYLVSASAVNLKTGQIIGRSDVWISDQNLDYASTKIYEDSPMYLKDQPVEGSVRIATGQVGVPADHTYYASLETMAMLVEAETAYGNGDYDTALSLLNRVSEQPDGQLMKTYAGLYSTYRRIGRMDLAETAFASLLSISVEKNRTMTVKFLFDVNSVRFWKDPELVSQYKIWLRQIGKYFADSSYCLRIIGHCSRTGTETYNENLSFERAYRIQELLMPYFPSVFSRSRAVGKGFSEVIKGIGTDDERDAIDRRVEFRIVDCDELWIDA